MSLGSDTSILPHQSLPVHHTLYLVSPWCAGRSLATGALQLEHSIWIALDQSNLVKGFGRKISRDGTRIRLKKLNRKRLLKWNHKRIHNLKHLCIHFLKPCSTQPHLLPLPLSALEHAPT